MNGQKRCGSGNTSNQKGCGMLGDVEGLTLYRVVFGPGDDWIDIATSEDALDGRDVIRGVILGKEARLNVSAAWYITKV